MVIVHLEAHMMKCGTDTDDRRTGNVRMEGGKMIPEEK